MITSLTRYIGVASLGLALLVFGPSIALAQPAAAQPSAADRVAPPPTPPAAAPAPPAAAPTPPAAAPAPTDAQPAAGEAPRVAPPVARAPAKPAAVVTPPPAAAPVPPAAAPAKPAKPAKKVDACAGRVDGSCQSPRHAWCQLLYWLKKKGDRWEPAKAAACFDTSGLKSGANVGPYAEMMKKVLDKNPTWVAVDSIPDNPAYVNAENLTLYEDVSVKKDYADLILIKRDGKWMFSAKALKKAKSLYEDTAEGVLSKYMPTVLLRPFLGIELWKYGAIILLLLIGFLVQATVVFLLGTYARRTIGRGHPLIDKVIQRAGRPIGGLAMAGVFRLLFPVLLFPPRISEIMMLATQALAAYSMVWLGYRMIDVLAELMAGKASKTESKLDDQLVPLISKTLKVFVSIVGGIFILQNLHVNVGSLLAGLGLGGLAFALAARDTIANFFGSVMIFIDKPFQIGDWVEIKGTEGTVEEVGFRTTRVRTFYNSLVTVPNALIVSSVVDNYGMRQFRRYVTTLGLCYDTPPEKVQAFCEGLRAIIAGMPSMRKDYYLVEFKDFGESSLQIMVYCFMISPSWNAELRTRTNLNLEILRLTRELGVSFAFPTRTLHIDTQAREGESRATHSGPTTREQLGDVVNGFGPGGKLAEPVRSELGGGYDCGRRWIEAGDGDGGE